MEQGLAMSVLPYSLYTKYGQQPRSPLKLLMDKEAYGVRHGTNMPKGEGWLGNIGTAEEPVTEYTINVDGREIPTVVPTLDKDEVKGLSQTALKGTEIPQSVVEKAIRFANERNRQGLSQFKD